MENIENQIKVKCACCGSTDFARNIWAYNMPAIAPAYISAEGKSGSRHAEQVTTDICRGCGTLRFYVTEPNRNWRSE